MKTKQIVLAVVTGALLTGVVLPAISQPLGVEAAKPPVKSAKTTKPVKAEKVSAKEKSEKALKNAQKKLKEKGIAKPFKAPVKGKVSIGFGDTPSFGFHDGVDIPAKKGTVVKAAYTGTVKEVVASDASQGRYIVVEHVIAGETFTTTYAHLDRSNVKVGQKVKSGQAIGHVGMTGRATGSHLHFSVHDQDEVAIDPEAVTAL